MYATLSTCQEEKVTRFVPLNFIDFKLELVLSSNFEISGINKCDKIFFVANSYRIPIRRPCYVDIFSCIVLRRLQYSKNIKQPQIDLSNIQLKYL